MINRLIDEAFDAYKKGQIAESEKICRQVIKVCPENPDVLMLSGAILSERQQHSKAAKCFKQAIVQVPEHAGLHNYYGMTLSKLGRFEESVGQFQKAVKLREDFARAYNNLAAALIKLERFEEAIAASVKAIEIRPGYMQAYNNLGSASMETGQFEKAVAAYEEAVKCDPDSAGSHHNLSHALLLTGNRKRGLEEYQWRWKDKAFSSRPRPFSYKYLQKARYDRPEKILVWTEQGVGDEVQFASLIDYVKSTGVQVVIECDKRLSGLLKRSLSGVDVVARTTRPPEIIGNDKTITHQIAICSLPYAFDIDIGEIRNKERYLYPDENLRKQLKTKYKNGEGVVLVGISWKSGNSSEGAKRSIPLKDFVPILETEGVRFVSLQYGQCENEIRKLSDETGIRIVKDETVNPLVDLERFAAQTAAMDIVVSIDNSTVHFAGAMGIETMTLLPTVPDWRWGLNTSRTRWYPSMRLLRQKERGQWQPVIEQAAEQLRISVGSYR